MGISKLCHSQFFTCLPMHCLIEKFEGATGMYVTLANSHTYLECQHEEKHIQSLELYHHDTIRAIVTNIM